MLEGMLSKGPTAGPAAEAAIGVTDGAAAPLLTPTNVTSLLCGSEWACKTGRCLAEKEV